MDQSYDFDYIVIGSGFGGSVSACRLTEKGYTVGVMEMGRRWQAEDFPKSDWDAGRFIWRPSLGLCGFYNIRPFRHVVVMCGNAVGGGSIAYANALLVPALKVWDTGSWSRLNDWKQVMPQHYATAERMLGVTDNVLVGEADLRLKKMADNYGVGDTYYTGRVGTFFHLLAKRVEKLTPTLTLAAKALTVAPASVAAVAWWVANTTLKIRWIKTTCTLLKNEAPRSLPKPRSWMYVQ